MPLDAIAPDHPKYNALVRAGLVEDPAMTAQLQAEDAAAAKAEQAAIKKRVARAEAP